MRASAVSKWTGLATAATVAAAAILCCQPLPAADNVLVEGNLPGTFGLRFGPDGLLYACSFAGVVVLDVNSGQMVGAYGPESGVFGPEDVNFGPDGSMYWAAMFTGEVGRMAPDGTVTTQMVGPGVNPIAFSESGRMFVSEPWATDTLFELDPELEQPPVAVAANLGGLKGTDFGPDGLLYGARMWQGGIVKIDVEADPVTVETVAAGIPGPFTAKFGPDGMLYVIERVGFTILRVDPATGAFTTYAELPFGPDNLAFNSDGRLFVSSYSDGLVAEVFPDGSHLVSVPGGLTLVSGIAVQPRPDGGESVWVGNLFALREYDGATGTERSVERFRWGLSEGFGGAVSVAAAGDDLVLTNFFPAGMGRVQRWSPDTGLVAANLMDFPVPVNAVGFGDDLVVADLGMGEGQARVVRVGESGTTVLADVTDQILVPLGLAAAHGNLWVGDWATGMIWQLIADGQELASPRPIAQGLSGPEGLAVDAGGSLLVVEAGAGRVSRVSPTSGAVTPLVGGLALGLPGYGTLPPFGTINGIDVGPSGAIYVAGDAGLVVYKLVPTTSYVTAVANRGGHTGSQWTTALELHNRGAVTSQITVDVLQRGRDNSSPRSASLMLGPGLAARYPNVLDDLFGLQGAAALRLTSFGGELMAAAHTATSCGGGWCGGFATARAADEAAVAGDEVRLIQLQNTTSSRTNLGLVNVSSAQATVSVTLYAADGSEVGQVTAVLEPFGYRQIDDLFHSLDSVKLQASQLDSISDAFAVLRTASEGGAFLAYAAVVDNTSNDGYLVPAW